MRCVTGKGNQRCGYRRIGRLARLVFKSASSDIFEMTPIILQDNTIVFKAPLNTVADSLYCVANSPSAVRDEVRMERRREGSRSLGKAKKSLVADLVHAPNRVLS